MFLNSSKSNSTELFIVKSQICDDNEQHKQSLEIFVQQTTCNHVLLKSNKYLLQNAKNKWTIDRRDASVKLWSWLKREIFI